MDRPDPGGAGGAGGPGGAGVGRADRPLGRGLEDVSHVFLSQQADGGTAEPAGRGARPSPRDAAAPGVVLLRPAAQVDRRQVAAILTEFAGALEEGLRTLDAELPCPPCGEIDLLAIDRASQLAIVDFDTASGDELLMRGLAHRDWVDRNLPSLRRMFRGQAINFSLPPKLFLVAPQFSPRVRCAARQITGLQVAWVRFHLVETPGRPGILFEALAAE
jgi:hypothetical protein